MSRREFFVKNSDGKPVADTTIYLRVTSGFWGNTRTTDYKQTDKKGFVGFNIEKDFHATHAYVDGEEFDVEDDENDPMELTVSD